MIWTILDYHRKLTDSHTLPQIKKKRPGFEKADHNRTLFERNNRPKPDQSHLNTRLYETNSRPIPDQTIVMFL